MEGRLDGAECRRAVLTTHFEVLGGSPKSCQLDLRGRRYLLHVLPLLDAAGQVCGCSAVVLDSTHYKHERRQWETEVRFRRALDEAVIRDRHYDGGHDQYDRLLVIAGVAVPSAQGISLWIRDEEGAYRLAASAGPLTPEPAGCTGGTQRVVGGSSCATPTSHPTHPGAEVGLPFPGTDRATLCLPVEVGGEPFAHLHFSHEDPAFEFGSDERERASTVARQLRHLVEYTRLLVDLREHHGNLGALLEQHRHLAAFSSEIGRIHDVDRLIDHGLEGVLKALAFDVAFLAEVDEEQAHVIRFKHAEGVDGPQLPLIPIPLQGSASGRAVRSREAVFVEDYPGGYAPLRSSGIQSLLVLPVERDGDVRYVLGFATIGRRVQVTIDAKRVALAFVSHLENAFDRLQHLHEIQATRDATFRSLGVALEHRDLETRGHTDRVVGLAERFAAAMSLGPERTQALVWGAYLHDLGKIGVPDEILLKPGRLDQAEISIMQLHTVHGVEMVRDIPFLPAETLQVIRSHHERWDGAGYPDGLAGEKIPLLARMFSFVDVYDALRSQRPYKRAFSHEEALAEIAAQVGSQFDAALLPVFVEVLAAGS